MHSIRPQRLHAPASLFYYLFLTFNKLFPIGHEEIIAFGRSRNKIYSRWNAVVDYVRGQDIDRNRVSVVTIGSLSTNQRVDR